jgi:hypothetical protein
MTSHESSQPNHGRDSSSVCLISMMSGEKHGFFQGCKELLIGLRIGNRLDIVLGIRAHQEGSIR